MSDKNSSSQEKIQQSVSLVISLIIEWIDIFLNFYSYSWMIKALPMIFVASSTIGIAYFYATSCTFFRFSIENGISHPISPSTLLNIKIYAIFSGLFSSIYCVSFATSMLP